MSVGVEPQNPNDDDAETDKLIGQVLANRYQIEMRLGEGAMGTVYRAKHVKVGRTFAVKVLHSHLLVDTKVQQRFEREAELAGRLRHPNVIGVVDVGETPDGMHYMVMDFAEGPDLADLLPEAPMPPQRVMHLTRQLLEGMYHAHEQGLIHRDFKPENVIIERDSHDAEVPRIVDFGIAILREGGDSAEGPGRLTTNGLVLGTPHYMAPEQAVADPIDHRIDLFALGIMIYEMLSGKLPFDGTGAEIARANLLLDPPAISVRVPHLVVDPLLEAFSRKLMAKKRDHRPATAKAARELLDLIGRDREAAAVALGVPAHVVRAPMTTQDAAPIRRHGDHDGTFPPPFRGEELPPRMAGPTAVPVPAQLGEPTISTHASEPIVRRRAPMIIAGIAGVGVLVTGALVLFSGGKTAPQKAPVALDHVASLPGSATEPQPDPSPGSAAVPPPIEDGSAGSATIEHAGSAVAAIEAASSEDASQTNVAKTTTTPTTKTKTKTTKTAKTTKTTKTTPNTTNVQTQKVEPQATPAVVETKAPATPVNASMLASQYQSVGSALKSLEAAKGADAAADLWPRYRFIRISDAMATQQKRDEAAKILAKLTGEIAARKR